jgi:uncharacterized protein
MLIIRAADLVAVPWKNGGGVTREIRREPGGADPFNWRLSVATIDSEGPFSAFDGYERTLVLVGGSGVLLRFSGHGEQRLTRIGDFATFDGSWQTTATPLAGPCSDLNLMVAQSLPAARKQSVGLHGRRVIATHDCAHTLIVCIAGACEIAAQDGMSAALQTLDSAHCVPADRSISCSPQAVDTQLFIASVYGD